MKPALAGVTLCVALWGMVFIAVHELLPLLSPVEMVTLRFAMTAVVLVALMAARRQWRPRFERRDWLLCVAAGLLAVPISQLAAIEGQRYVSPSIAALITTTAPVAAAALGAGFLGERISLRNLAGFAIALGGVALIVVLGAGSGADGGATDPLGAAITVLGPIAWAVYTLLSKPVSDRHPVIPTVGVTMLFATLALAPALPASVAGLGAVDATGWVWLAFLVLGGTVAPFLLWSASLKAFDVSRASSFMYLIPVFATTWSILLLGSTLTAVTLAGGAAVIGGVALTQAAPR